MYNQYDNFLPFITKNNIIKIFIFFICVKKVCNDVFAVWIMKTKFRSSRSKNAQVVLNLKKIKIPKRTFHVYASSDLSPLLLEITNI